MISSAVQWVIPTAGLRLLSFMFLLWYQSTDDDSLVTLGTDVYEALKTGIVSFALSVSYFRYVVPSLRAEESHATRAFMAVLLGGIALVNLHARSGGSGGGFSPLGRCDGIPHIDGVFAMWACPCSRRKPYRQGFLDRFEFESKFFFLQIDRRMNASEPQKVWHPDRTSPGSPDRARNPCLKTCKLTPENPRPQSHVKALPNASHTQRRSFRHCFFQYSRPWDTSPGHQEPARKS